VTAPAITPSSVAAAILAADDRPPRRTAPPNDPPHRLALALLTAALALEAERVGELGLVKLETLYNRFDRRSPLAVKAWLGPHLEPGQMPPAGTDDSEHLWNCACGIAAEALDVADCRSYQVEELPPDDTRAPVYRRFAPTRWAIWDLARHRLLCYVCRQWTDTEGMDPGQRALGRIYCAHCGAVVQL
jgi:hypothetical protein